MSRDRQNVKNFSVPPHNSVPPPQGQKDPKSIVSLSTLFSSTEYLPNPPAKFSVDIVPFLTVFCHVFFTSLTKSNVYFLWWNLLYDKLSLYFHSFFIRSTDVFEKVTLRTKKFQWMLIPTIPNETFLLLVSSFYFTVTRLFRLARNETNIFLLKWIRRND